MDLALAPGGDFHEEEARVEPAVELMRFIVVDPNTDGNFCSCFLVVYACVCARVCVCVCVCVRCAYCACVCAQCVYLVCACV